MEGIRLWTPPTPDTIPEGHCRKDTKFAEIDDSGCESHVVVDRSRPRRTKARHSKVPTVRSHAVVHLVKYHA
jgi:hypothetical protein